MPIIITADEIKQNSPEWDNLRRGKPTSSAFSRIQKINGERSDSWDGYVQELALEAVSGVSNNINTWQMRLGHAQEPEARWIYSQRHGVEVQEVAFVYHDEKRLFGCSTDGLVGDDGVFECKGGEGKTHVARLLKHKKSPEAFTNKHFQQIQGELFVTGREWCDMMGYFPGLRSLFVRVYRDEPWIERLSAHLEVFCLDLVKAISELKSL